jgi:hypothetical protein
MTKRRAVAPLRISTDDRRYWELCEVRDGKGLIPRELTAEDLAWMAAYARKQAVKVQAREVRVEREARRTGKTVDQVLRDRLGWNKAIGLTTEPEGQQAPARPVPRAPRGNAKTLAQKEGTAFAAAVAIQANAEDETRSDALLTAKDLALACLPKRRIPGGYVARSIRLGLDTWAKVEFISKPGEMPFGQDRLPMVAVFTRAIESQSPLVEYSSTLEVLRAFGLPEDGRAYSRFRDGFRRISRATVNITYGRTQEEVESGNLGEGMKLIVAWNLPSDHDLKDEAAGLVRLPFGPTGFRVKLSQEFWDYLRQPGNQALAPVEIMRRYQDEPAAWDFAWFVLTRGRHAKTLSAVPHSALMDSFRDAAEADRDVIRRLAGYLKDLQDAAGGTLNAWLEEGQSIKPEGRGRPRKQWVLKIGPSPSLLWSGKKKGSRSCI